MISYCFSCFLFAPTITSLERAQRSRVERNISTIAYLTWVMIWRFQRNVISSTRSSYEGYKYSGLHHTESTYQQRTSSLSNISFSIQVPEFPPIFSLGYGGTRNSKPRRWVNNMRATSKGCRCISGLDHHESGALLGGEIYAKDNDCSVPR